MKTPPTKIMAIAALLLCTSGSSIAATTTENPSVPITNPPPNPQPSARFVQGPPEQGRNAENQPPATSAAYEDTRGRPASALIGRDVVGAADAKLGRLDDFIVELESGKIVYCVVSSTGTKGAGEGLRAVPFNAVIPELAADGLRMRINVDEAVWTKTPRFEKRLLHRLSEDESLLREDIHRHFGLQAPLVKEEDGQPLVLVREMMGKPLHRGEETIAKIEDVIVHLPSHMAAVLIDPRDNFVGTDQKFIVPFSNLTITENNEFTTTINVQHFTSAPVSTDATWAVSTGAFKAPYLWPVYGTSATPLAHTPPPAQNRGVSATRPPVEEIRQALAADAHTRWTDVRVIAANDRVILVGNVQDEDDKRRVESRVSQAAGGWKIDNQIRIAGTGR